MTVCEGIDAALRSIDPTVWNEAAAIVSSKLDPRWRKYISKVDRNRFSNGRSRDLFSSEWSAWYNEHQQEFATAMQQYLQTLLAQLQQKVIVNGKMVLYRKIGLYYNLVKAIAEGKRDLGVHWTYQRHRVAWFPEDPDDYVDISGFVDPHPKEFNEPKQYWIKAEFNEDAADWLEAVFNFSENHNIESEITLQDNQPARILAISVNDWNSDKSWKPVNIKSIAGIVTHT